MFNIAHASLLVLGLARGDLGLVARGLGDRIHQPRRAHLYPRSWELVQGARDLGALGATISGAGPTVLVWCDLASTGAVHQRLHEVADGLGRGPPRAVHAHGRRRPLAVIVLLHGFMDSPRTWDLVRPYLGEEEVLAPALPGHLGGPPLQGDFDLAGHVERVHGRGGRRAARTSSATRSAATSRSLLATRGRAKTVVALAPAGGGDHARHARPARRAGRRAAVGDVSPRRELPERDRPASHLGARACRGVRRGAADRQRARARLAAGRDQGPLPGARRCGALEDRLLPWPAAAERYRRSLDAEWIELDGVGHAPQLDIPLETAQLILGFTTARIASSKGPSSSPFSR